MNAMTHFFIEGKGMDDRLSPILIKELRQGMRARAFVLSFLFIQLFLILLVLANLAAGDDYSALNSQNEFFWLIVGFALLFLMPFRGLVAISQEIRHNTIETILLTRLTSWRVVFGKWSALFAQSLLFVAAVLPYVVLRYFIGGDDVVSDFEWLFFLLWLSGMLIAAAIAVSALGNAVVRIIVILALIVLSATGLGNLSSSGPTGAGFWEILGWLAIFGFFTPALLFEITASSIAPISENHAVRRRGLAVGFFVLATLLYHMTHSDFSLGLVLPMIALIGICYLELAEKPQLSLRLVLPLRRWGALSRIGGLFLLPGWPSALLFSLVVIPPMLVVPYAEKATTFSIDPFLGYSLMLCAIFGSVLVPILICHLFWRKMKQVFLMIVLYNIILFGLASLLAGFAALLHSDINQMLAFTPGIPVLFTLLDSSGNTFFLPTCLVANCLVILILLVILFAASVSYFRNLWALIRTARENGAS